MNSPKYYITRAWLLALLLTVPAETFAQSEGTLVTTEEAKKEVAKIQDRAIERKIAIEQINAPEGPMATANTQTRTLLQNVQGGSLEDAARLYFEGVQNGVPDLLKKTADELEQASRQAAGDAASVVRLTRITAKTNAASAISNATGAMNGAAAREIEAALRKVEEQNKALNDDLKNYVAKFIEPFPEMKLALAEAGLTPATLREIVEGRLSEADQLAYRAKLLRINIMIWDNLPRIIKTRAVNGGKGQPIITNSAAEAIKAAQSDKIF